MQGIEDCFVPPEGTLVLPDDPAVLPTFQPVGVSSDLNRSPDGAGIDRVSVLVEPNETGL